MNLLAHALLSFDQPGILAGNMINDYVKGRKKFDYPIMIQKGMELHRNIDQFTDAHPVTARAKKYFNPQYRLYSGAFVDIVYDHYLANSEEEFKQYGGLNHFTQRAYTFLGRQQKYFPDTFQRIFPYMQAQDWLYHYRFKEGIKNAFGGLVHRAKYLHESAIGFQIFEENYNELQYCYTEFFPELKEFAIIKFKQLTER